MNKSVPGKLRGPKSKRTFGRPPFEPHRSGPWVIYRNPALGHTQHLTLNERGLLAETRDLADVRIRFSSYDLALAFVLAAPELLPGVWKIGRR